MFGKRQVTKALVGKNIHLFPDTDLALLTTDTNGSQPYVPLEYGEIPEGIEIGVAGYPLPALHEVNGVLKLDGLIYRVAKSVVTATYVTNVHTDQDAVDSVPLIEVNFLFVPGNSGGPIFVAETGRVGGFVKGYRTAKIREKVEEVNLIKDFPEKMDRKYVENLTALYSFGIKLSHVRRYLEQFGVSL